MEKHSRSGRDRRRKTSSVKDDRRYSKERRLLLKDPMLTVGKLRTFPIFDGLTKTEYKTLLSICTALHFQENEVICSIGDKSDIMFILIEGKLQVTFQDNRVLRQISPKGIIGKVGFFTGKNHQATVRAEGECSIITIKKDELYKVFKKHNTLWVKILSNLVMDLSDVIEKNNEFIKKINNACYLEMM